MFGILWVAEQAKGGGSTEGVVSGDSGIYGGQVTVTDPNGANPNASIGNSTTSALGSYSVTVDKKYKGKTVNVHIEKGEGDNKIIENKNGVTVSYLNPPDNNCLTAFAISAGTATFGGNSYSLSGTFSAVDTAVDYNPLSATYGNVSGSVLASSLQITATGSAGTLAISLSYDAPYTMNLASMWALENPFPYSVSFSYPFSGNVLLNGGSTPFSGTATASVTMDVNLVDSTSVSAQVNTQYGEIDFSFQGQGQESLIAPIPEPSTFTLFGLGTLSLLACGWRRRTANA